MKSVQEQQQPNSMDSSDSTTTTTSEYAYRPLTTKHRRAGSTGTTGDEEYTTDEDELYGDETDCVNVGSVHHAPHPLLKSDLARAATDLFGYSDKRDDEVDEPTSLFDDDDNKFCRDSSTKSISIFTYNEAILPRGILARRRSSTDNNNKASSKQSQQEQQVTKQTAKDEVAVENSCPKLQQNNDISSSSSSSSSYSSESSNSTSAEARLRGEEEKLPVAAAQRCNEETTIGSDDLINDDDRKSRGLDVTANTENELSTSASSDVAASEASSDEAQIESKDIEEIEEDVPPSPSALQWGRAVTEVKEQAIAKLQDELHRAHEELKLKDEEVARLSRIRQDVEAELEELTASLFQEAHNMVREANQRQATAERLLEESRMKAEVLAAEVAALKTLVLTSTPAQPNPHLHPQIACNGGSDDSHHHHHHHHHHNHHQQNAGGGVGGIFAKKHRRSPSHFNLKYGRENSPPDSPQREQRISLPCCESAAAAVAASAARDSFDKDTERERDREREKKRESYLLNQLICSERDRERETKDLGLEVDPRVHGEFLRWKANPCVDKSDPFIERIFHEDIDLCLDFPNAELAGKVRQAVLDGIIFVEAVSDKTKQGFPKKCALLEAPRQCHYRMRMGDQENQWHSISQICRNRIIAVCDFLNYLRYIERGLVKSSVHDVYWEITRLRKEMVLARLGLALSV